MVLASNSSYTLLAHQLQFYSFGLVGMTSRSHTFGFKIQHFAARVGSNALARLTPRCTRTPPALPPALSQPLATSASFIVSVQAWPVSFFR